MWIYRAASTPRNDSLIYLPLDPRYDLWFVDDDLCVNTGNTDRWGVRDSTLTNRWVHVAAVFANGPTVGSELYLDGVLRTLTCTSAPANPCNTSASVRGPLYLGGGDDVYQWYGKLDEVRFYDHALSPNEAQHVFDGTLCPP